jgi:hypothetical protein
VRRLFLILPLLNACDLTGPDLPAGAVSFTPYAVYGDWWALTEQCSGLRGELAAVKWYRVPDVAEFSFGDGSSVNGRWDPSENRIILAGKSEFRGDVVRHEMLHALLRQRGHPRADFVGGCGGIVVCAWRCLIDAGPAPAKDPTAQLVSPSTLEIGLEVNPPSPSSSINDGVFMMVITAHNPTPLPVIAELPASPDEEPSVSFSLKIVGTAGIATFDARAEAPEVGRFAAFETKRFIFDFRIGAGRTRYDQPPGTYQFNGAYGGVWAANPPTIIVSP